MVNNIITLDNVSHSYGEKNVLDKISFSVEEGEIFGLLGPSGAGKTTIINILTGQIKNTGGVATILGEKCDGLSAKIYEQIGIMTDSLGLFERLSVYDNLKFFADLQGVPYKKINQVLEEVGLYHDRKRAVSKLSKGMKNRTSLARAVLCDSKLLFLDEPTSGLDPTTANEIHELIKKYQSKGCTIFMTTHNMTEAEELCTHVALLNRGKIIQYGTPKQICLQHNTENQFCITLKTGEIMVLENSPQSAEIVYDLLSRSQIIGMHTSEPDLKDVFLHLTGGNRR